MNHSIRLAATKGLGEVDELLTANLGSDLSSLNSLAGSSPYFPMERVDELRRELEGYDKIDGLAPFISEGASVSNLTSKQNVGRMIIVGIEVGNTGVFGRITSVDGGTLDNSVLSGKRAFINDSARDELDASVGDSLAMYLESGQVELEVAGSSRMVALRRLILPS